jgi:hypothetical protein
MAFKHTTSFHELLTSPFAGDVNALCWSRSLPGDYAEVVAKLGPGEGIVALDEERLRGLELSGKGKEAVEQMLVDLALLRDAGRDPVLNIIYGYPKDEDGGPVPTDVMSWHVDSAPVEADTWLCTYHGAPSEGLLNEQAVRKVDDPKIRAQLLELYHQSSGVDPQVSGLFASVSPSENRGQTPADQQGGTARSQVSAFEDWLSENHYDLHYSARPGAVPYSLGHFNLWRITCAWPGSPVPPCVHRAPVSSSARLLLIS